MADAVRNTIELNIYNEDLEIVKTYQTYGIRWKAFKQIMGMQDELDALKEMEDAKAIEKIHEVLRLVYPTLTETDLDEAYTEDLFNCFMQAVNVAKRMAKNS